MAGGPKAGTSDSPHWQGSWEWVDNNKENKAACESGVITEYLRALDVEVKKLRGLMNGIFNGTDIPKEWRESRVKLLHKGGRTDESKTTERSR